MNIILATNQNHFDNFGRGPGVIPVEFGKISISGSREEVVRRSSLPYIIQRVNSDTPGRVKYEPRGII